MKLTESTQAILKFLLSEGQLSHKEIAAKLNLNPWTIAKYAVRFNLRRGRGKHSISYRKPEVDNV